MPVTLLWLKRHIPYTVKKEINIMRKSTLFISVVLTTFMLAVLYGVVSAYQSIIGSTEMAAQSQPTAMAEMVNQPVAVVPPTQAVPQTLNITPDAAAALASKVLNRTDLYSVEVSQFEGADAYLVTFSSGDLVYLGLDGQVLSISKLPVTTVVQKGSKPGAGNKSTTGSSASSGEHEDNEHEGDDD
jgi:hypothetical protein